ncbi:uncharacterized protein LOC115924256 [Strongylocentrotus purpuratus]|uniref:F5/8 type C domain-containing protein n=1 Tax=Strongylocentrotus purpuratus TaxID=7668 RepID=A0A7M7NVN5_STRPU|nr:uncharacterized protein LOC115924256 [Strongylocentrotus purpuratus]
MATAKVVLGVLLVKMMIVDQCHGHDPVPLGLESNVIPDSSLTASSEYNADHGAKRGRLNLARVGNLRGAWSALTNNANQWIQVDLLNLYRVISVATQGREDVSQWVTSYKLACSTDGTTFHTVQGISTNPGADRIFTGNGDRNTIVTNTLPVPQICRYVRLMPVSWFGHISLRMEIYGEGPLTANLNDPDPLGLESYVIPDSSLTASSEYNADHGAKRGRLNLARVGNLRGAWSARTNDANQWIQVDLLDLYRVISVATQGREDVSQWVTSYKLACSTDGMTFHTVQGISTNPGADRIFTGNVDRNTIVTNTLPVPQICRYVRLMPVSWFGHISLRMEIYGEGPLTANLNDPDPLGLESYVIPDSSLTASSEYNADHGAKRGRLNLARVGNLRGAWSARTNDANQWIQVDLLDLYRVISVATQGREDVSQWVTSYKLACSTDGTTFHTVQGISTNPGADRIFTGNVDRNTIVTNTLPVPQICRYVRLMPVSWFGHISLRMEIYGEGPLTANLNDPDPLGLESYVIPDSSLTASSEYNADHGAKRGRLNLARVGNLRGAWSARTNDANQWIQVDLLDLYRVISVATQGREDVSQWVTSYKLACSTDGTTFHTVQGISTNPGADRIFTGNVDRNTIVTNTLPVPQICRYVRLMPVSWFGHISLRMEIYGEGPLTANLNDPDPLGLESYVIPDSSLTASSEYNADHGAKRGRLNLARVGNLRGAWSARTNDANQWIQVDLLDLYRVISVATQGREDVSQWVTSYKLACSTDGTTFHTVQGISTNPGADRVSLFSNYSLVNIIWTLFLKNFEGI